jgi:hypothetical protein
MYLTAYVGEFLVDYSSSHFVTTAAVRSLATSLEENLRHYGKKRVRRSDEVLT